jgi:hypothetical protein
MMPRIHYTKPSITELEIRYATDATAAKKGKFMPGCHFPIFAQDELLEQRPDYLVILPWNIAVEVKQQNARMAKLGTKFVTAVPKLEIA